MAQHTNGTRQSESVSERVVVAVAATRDVDPLELPPLYDVVDPDALNQFFDHAQRTSVRVTFTIAGCEVVVHSDGEVDVTASDERASHPSAADHAAGRDGAEPTFE